VCWWGRTNAQPRCRQPSTFFFSFSFPPTAPGWPSPTHRRQHGGGKSLGGVVANRPRRVAGCTKGRLLDLILFLGGAASCAVLRPRVKDRTGILDLHGLPPEAGRRRRRSPELLSPGTHSCPSSSSSPAWCAPLAGLLVVVAYRAVSWLPIEISASATQIQV